MLNFNNQQAFDNDLEYRESESGQNRSDLLNYDEIEDDLYQEIREKVYLIMGKTIPDDKKDTLTISLFDFIQQQVMEFADQMNESLNTISPANNFVSGLNNPFFNNYGQPFYSLPAPTTNNFTNPLFFQPINAIQPTPYNYPFQIQYPQSLPLYQPPNSLYVTSKQSSKSQKSHKHEKSKSKHKKSKSKADKKSKKHHKSHLDNFDIQKFEYNSENPFNGIFNFLRGKVVGNIHDNSMVRISTNSQMASFHPKNLVDFNSSSDYIAKGDDFYAWVMFDFLNNEVEISSYTIKSSHCTIGHLRSWVIEISMDGNQWEIIDERKDDASLNGQNIVKNFEVKEKKKKFSKFCRFRHTGEYWGFEPECTSIEFNAIEFYGKLKMPKL